MAKKFTVIVAADNQWGIGREGKLPWRLKGDMDYFRKTTTGHAGGRNAILVGSKTFESIHEKFRPLPERLNVVMTRNKLAAPYGLVLHAYSLNDALLTARCHAGINEVFVIGGGQIYAEAINHPECAKILVTAVGATYGCDTFFPNLDRDERYQLANSSAPLEERGVTYVYQTYLRK